MHVTEVGQTHGRPIGNGGAVAHPFWTSIHRLRTISESRFARELCGVLLDRQVISAAW